MINSYKTELHFLGCLINENELIDVFDIEDGLFYGQQTLLLWKGIKKLVGDGRSVDYATLCSSCDEDVVIEAMTSVLSVSKVEDYYRSLQEMHIKRQTLSELKRLEQMCREPLSTVGMIQDKLSTISEITSCSDKKQETSLEEAVNNFLADTEGGETIPTGFTKLDEMLGLRKTNFIAVGARPGAGKSSYLASMAVNMATAGFKVLFISLEMSIEEMSARFISISSYQDFRKIYNKEIKESDYDAVGAGLERMDAYNKQISIISTGGYTMQDLKSDIIRKKYDGGVDVVIVDYIQLMQFPKSLSRYEGITNISRDMKIVAMDYDVLIIGAVQLNRKSENSNDKKPMLSHIRDSGCLHGDTLITMADGTTPTIKSLVGCEGMSVLNYTEEGVATVSKVVKCWKTGNKPAYRMKVRGYHIDATADHRFLTQSGRTHLSDISVGDLVAIPRVSVSRSGTDMPYRENFLLGQMIGDGSFVEGRCITYCSGKDCLVNQLIQRVSDNFKIRSKKYDRKTYTEVGFYCENGRTGKRKNDFREYLEGKGLYGLRSHEKFVPDDVLRQSDKGLREFLGSLWSTDGTVCVCKRQGGTKKSYVSIAYSSTSYRLVTGIQSILLRLGIESKLTSTKKGDYKNNYILNVTTANSKKLFFDLIEIPYRDVSEAAEELTTSKPGRRKNIMEDLCFCKVISIDEIGHHDVYDMEIEENHNFIANGIVAHNCIEQDVNACLLLHREEMHDEFADDAKGKMDVIVAKNRNGPCGEVQLNFKKDCMTVMN